MPSFEIDLIPHGIWEFQWSENSQNKQHCLKKLQKNIVRKLTGLSIAVLP